MPQYFLIEKDAPYTGSSESVWDPEKDRVLWSATYKPELGRDLTLAEFMEVKGKLYRPIYEDELYELDAAYEKTLITSPRRITEDEWDYALGVLPPCRWSACMGVDSFHISERIRGSLVSWYCHYGDNTYCAFNDLSNREKEYISKKALRLSTYEAIERACMAADPTYKPAT